MSADEQPILSPEAQESLAAQATDNFIEAWLQLTNWLYWRNHGRNDGDSAEGSRD